MRLSSWEMKSSGNASKRIVNTTMFVLTVCISIFQARSLDIDSAFCRCEKVSHFGKPFVVLWNSPTEGCRVNFSVDVELEKFGILTNTNQTWDGEVVTVFYNAQLGLYPYFDEHDSKIAYNGGLPQLVNMTNHLLKSSQDIAVKIPDHEFSGLAVIDWERWRPLWDTNFGKKRIYKSKSMELVRKEKIFKKDEIVNEAKRRFENAAKLLMQETIQLARKLRPKALWGFYGFPCCHGNITTGFSCTNQNKQWNDDMRWLYRSSTALFPSIYLLEEHDQNHKFVAERLAEAFRLSLDMAREENRILPVFPYLRPLYLLTSHEFKMLNEDDLENAIGQAADLGSAGLVLWGNHHDERTSRAVCTQYNDYVNKKLGPYISLLSEELETCSKDKCSSNGRCVDKSLLTSAMGNHDSNISGDRTCDSVRKHAVFNITRQPYTVSRLKTSSNRTQSPMKLQDKIGGRRQTSDTLVNIIDSVQKRTYSARKGASTHSILTDHKQGEDSNISKKLTNNTVTNITVQQHENALRDGTSNKTRNKKEESFDPEWNKNGILGTRGEKSEADVLQKEMKPKRKKTFATPIESSKKGGRSNITLTRSQKAGKRAGSHKDLRKYEVPAKEKHPRKRGYSAAEPDETAVRVPSVYIILITVTLGGALLMTVIYVAIYYAVNVRGRSHDHSFDYNYGGNDGDENPFSVGEAPWWQENVEQEKLLKNSEDNE